MRKPYKLLFPFAQAAAFASIALLWQVGALLGQLPSQKQAKLPFRVVSGQEREQQLKLEEVDLRLLLSAAIV